MIPFLGQGANSAIIDGYVLGHFLSELAAKEAFARYEARRMAGVHRNLRSARRICDMMTSDSRWASLACRVLFGCVPDGLMEGALLRADRINDVRDLIERRA